MDASTRPSFGMDVITSSIRDLQKEKLRNEQRLSEMRSRRRSVESKHEAVISKVNQLSEIKGKMADTLRVAHYKVSQSQAAIECQHGTNQELEKHITGIRASIKEEEMREQQQIKVLEGKLTNLIELFRSGKDSYLDLSLQEDIHATEKDVQDLTSKVTQSDTEAEKLVGLFEAMEIVASKQEEEQQKLTIPLQVQHDLVNAFKHEKKLEELDLESKSEMKRQLLCQLEE